MSFADQDTPGSGNLPRPLRVGVLLDALVVPAWVYGMFERLTREGHGRLALVVVNASPRSPETLRGPRGRKWATMLYRLYRRWDARCFRRSPDALQDKDASALLAGIPLLRVWPRQTDDSDRLADDDVERIRQYDLDVLVRIGFRALRGDVLSAAKFGIWSFRHADYQADRGVPAGFWEVFRKEPATATVLQKAGEDPDNGLVLYRSFSATDAFSVRRNNNARCWSALAFVPRVVREIRESGGENLPPRIERLNAAPQLDCRPLDAAPTNGRFLRALSSHLRRKAQKKFFDAFYRSQWFLLYDFNTGGFAGPARRYKAIVPPRDRFWADPQVLFRDGKYYIYFEELLYSDMRGFISLIVMDPDGTYGPPTPVLKREYHLSYPFVFEWRNDLYMVPESSQNKTIELYRCTRFPDRWEFHRNLMENVVAVNTTLFQRDGKWWLFTNMAETPGASVCDELFLFSSDDPVDGRWAPHPGNPVVSDVRSSRPAGPIVEWKGRYFRPSQDSSNPERFCVRLNEITTLSQTAYEESDVCVLEPKWKDRLLGIHTISRANGLTVLDALHRVSAHAPFQQTSCEYCF